MGESGRITQSARWRVHDWFPELPTDCVKALRIFNDELLKFNPKINLISRKTEATVDQVHFADSIMAGKLVLQANRATSILDIGSGNGFPGLVMAALAPDRRFILLDKDVRKIEFLKHSISKMGLSNVSTHNGLIEDFKSERFSCAISRGFASLTGSLIAARKVISSEGEYYHMKSSNWVREVAEIPTQICSAWSPRLLSDYQLPASSVVMSLVVARKIG